MSQPTTPVTSTRRYVEHGINWNWFTEVQFHPDHTATILAHYRLHRDDLRLHPAAVHVNWPSEVQLIERTGRLVHAIRIFGEEWPVRNQTYIFDFNHAPVMPRDKIEV